MNSKMRSSVMGLILGQFSSPLPMAQKEPVAYLYNGVRLPKLPEWDKVTYPYAYIGSSNSNRDTSTMKIRFCDKPLVYDADLDRTNISAYTYYIDYFWASGDLEWSGMKVDSNYRPGAASGILGPAVWSNVDFYDEAGNLILAASDPIPVYE